MMQTYTSPTIKEIHGAAEIAKKLRALTLLQRTWHTGQFTTNWNSSSRCPLLASIGNCMCIHIHLSTQSAGACWTLTSQAPRRGGAGGWNPYSGWTNTNVLVLIPNLSSASSAWGIFTPWNREHHSLTKDFVLPRSLKQSAEMPRGQSSFNQVECQYHASL